MEHFLQIVSRKAIFREVRESDLQRRALRETICKKFKVFHDCVSQSSACWALFQAENLALSTQIVTKVCFPVVFGRTCAPSSFLVRIERQQSSKISSWNSDINRELVGDRGFSQGITNSFLIFKEDRNGEDWPTALQSPIVIPIVLQSPALTFNRILLKSRTWSCGSLLIKYKR